MKANFKIGEWLVAIFAAVMRNLFPTLSVKYFTKYKDTDSSRIIYWDEKERKEKAMRYLPSVEAQLRAVSKLQLTEEEIRCRVWSRETIKEMFRQGNFALISTLTGADEDLFEVIVKSGNSKKTAEAFAKATPKVYYLRDFLKNALNAVAVFKLAPQAFNALDYSDIPEGRKKEFLGTILLPGMEERSKAEKAAIQSWAEKLYGALVGRDESAADMDDDDKFLFEAAVKMLVKTKDLSKDLWLIRNNHSQAYGLLFEAIKKGGNRYIASYLRMALPEAKKALAGEDVKFSKVEAYDWLDVAMSHIDNPDVQGAILASLEDELAKENPEDNAYNVMQALLVNRVCLWCHVKRALRVLPKIFSSNLEKRLVASVYNAESAEQCLSMVSESYADELVVKMIKYTTDQEKAGTLLGYFPFSNWSSELAEKAVRKLAELQALPMDKFAELPEDLQKVAEEELEICSQYKCLESGKSDSVMEMMKHPLRSKVELYLFIGSYHFYANSYVEEYIRNNRVVDESNFRALCHMQHDSNGYETQGYVDVEALLLLYAEKHGLTRQNWLDLMNSPYSRLAPNLKQYVADVVVSGEDAEGGEVVEVIGGGVLDGENTVVINCDKDEAKGYTEA